MEEELWPSCQEQLITTQADDDVAAIPELHLHTALQTEDIWGLKVLVGSLYDLVSSRRGKESKVVGA